MTSHTLPALAALVDNELSLKSRLGYVALLLAAMMMSAVIGALWLTEPALPQRTELAFGVMLLIGVSWIAFAIWVLAARRVLLAYHAIVAGRMAVGFTALFLLGALALALGAGSAAAWGAAAAGAGMLAAAVLLLIKARRKLARLVARRAELERQLGANR